MTVEGYPSRLSAFPGESLEVCCSGRGPMRVEVARLGAERVVVWIREQVEVEPQPTPDDAAQSGCGWAPTFTVDIGDDWRSGCYAISFEPADGSPSRQAMFVVRAPVGRRTPALLVLSTATYLAYNDWGGPNLYEGADHVNLDRPWSHGFVQRPYEAHGRHAAVGPDPDPDNDRLFEYLGRHGLSVRCAEAGFASWEALFVAWAERHGFEIDIAQSLDLHRDPACLDGYRCYLSVGHDEYWSWEMRDAVEGFIAAGGNAAFLSGNTAFWQVRLSADERTMIGHKFVAPWNDPVVSDGDPHRMTGMWSDPLTERPENSMTGVSFTRGGYARFGYSVPRGSGGYTVWRPDHWALAGTDLRYGDLLGAGPVVVGYEADGCDLAIVDGLPVATGSDGTPTDLSIVATSPAHLFSSTADHCDLPPRNNHPHGVPADLEYAALRLFGDMDPATTARLAQGHAVMGSFRVPGGGEVFTTGCTDWSHGLAGEPDPAVAQVTRNVLTRLTNAPT